MTVPCRLERKSKWNWRTGSLHLDFPVTGKAYGNRNQLQRKDDRYYINGLKLEADEGFGYGVVEVRKKQ